MESEYTETANQFLDCVNKLNVHTCAYTSLQKERKKRSSASRLSSRCNLMNCYCDGPVTPHQNVPKEQIKIKKKNVETLS